MPLWQIRLSTRGRLAPFPGEAEQRAALRALARVAGERLVLFALVDEHVHAVLACGEGAGQAARAVRLALQHLARSPLQPVWVEAVGGRNHLESLLRYYLGQPRHHGLPVPAALWSGSCFPDLIGARLLPGFRDQLAEQLPRLPRAAVFQAVGLPGSTLEPADDAALRRAGATRLAAAAAAALAVGPSLAGREAGVIDARAAACQLAKAAGLPTSELAHALGAPLRTVQRLGSHPLDPAILFVVRRRVALEDLAAAQPPVPMTAEPDPPYGGDPDLTPR